MMVSIELLKSWDRERSLVLISGGILAIVSIFGCALKIDLRMMVEKQQSRRGNTPCILEAKTGLKVVWGFRHFGMINPFTPPGRQERKEKPNSTTNQHNRSNRQGREG